MREEVRAVREVRPASVFFDLQAAQFVRESFRWTAFPRVPVAAKWTMDAKWPMDAKWTMADKWTIAAKWTMADKLKMAAK